MAGPTTAEPGARPQSDSGRGQGPPAGRFRWSGRRSLIAAAAVILLVAGGVWVLYGSDWLRVEGVRATGTRVLTPAEVEDAAAVPMGAPLISVDTGAIEARLLKRLPRLDSVEAVRSWPHGIRLKVIERSPVLLIARDAKFVEVDAGGVRFATVDKAPKGVLMLELTPDQSPAARRFTTGRLVLEAVRVRADLPGEVARRAKALRVRSYDAITVELRDGRTVMWGSGEDGAAKSRALSALMKAAPKAGRFDVSAPTAPAASGS